MKHIRQIDEFELEVTKEDSNVFRVDLFEGNLCAVSRTINYGRFGALLCDEEVFESLLWDNVLIEQLIEEGRATA